MAEIVGEDESMAKYAGCRGCGGKVKYHRRDIKEYTEYDYGGGSDRVRYVKCPRCKEEIRV